MQKFVEGLFAWIENWGKIAWGMLFWGSVLGAATLALWPEATPALVYGASAALGAAGGWRARQSPGRAWL